MTPNEIISSGKLELYVSGVLSDKEMYEISTLAENDTDLRNEITRVQDELIEYAESFGEEPSEDVRAAIMKDIPNNVIPFKLTTTNKGGGGTGVMKFMLAASMTAFIISTIGLFMLNAKVDKLADENAVLKERTTQTAQLTQAYQDKLDFMNHQSVKKIKLEGMPQSPGNYVMVYWSPVTHDVMMSSGNLPPLPADKQYQLWALHNGTPIDAGVFDAGNFLTLKKIEAAEAFAVTIEPKGGSKSPTMITMSAMGKI